MSIANSLWGAPRIHGELLKLGIEIGQTSVAKYMATQRGPPSQGWKTFHNHADGIAAMDLFVVPTISFRLLYGLLIVGHGRRQIFWFGVTSHPTAEWIANQIKEACGWEQAPRYLTRDRDGAYGEIFIRRLRSMGIRDRPTSPRSPWQNGYAERLIGSIPRECVDHTAVAPSPKGRCSRLMGNTIKTHTWLRAFIRTHQYTKEPHKGKRPAEKAAQSPELKAAFIKHERETRGQIARLEKVFKIIGKPVRGKVCEAINGITDEGAEIMREFKGAPALDAGLLASAQAVEHYEIARYGTLRTWAEELGFGDAARLFEATLVEEKTTDKNLTALAKSVVNIEAEGVDA